MAKAKSPARGRLARLLRFVRGHRRAVIAAQDRPDPDGMASAAALKRLLKEKARLDVAIAATVREIELRFLRLLEVPTRTPEYLVPELPANPNRPTPGPAPQDTT